MSGASAARRAFLAVLLVAGSPLPSAEAQLIVRKAGAGAGAQIAQALAKSLQGSGAPPRVVELTGDALADAARLARESRGLGTVFAIGPDATDLAGEARGPAVVSLGVPNPARVKTAGTYVSVYPSLDKVMAYVKNELRATSAGLLFSPARNREVALSFLKAGEPHGVTVVPVPVTSPADLTRELRGALAKVQVLLLAVDPIVFDPQSLEFIVKESQQAGRPTVGFLEEMTRLGITVSIVAPPEALAAAAAAAARAPVTVGKKRVEVDEAVVIVSKKAADVLRLSPEALGAHRTQ